MANTINTAIEATEAVAETVNTMDLSVGKKEAVFFALGVTAALAVEHGAIPAALWVKDKAVSKFSKNKPVESTAEVIDIEE